MRDTTAKKGSAGFFILLALLLLSALALLELNKNTLSGWGLTLALFAVYAAAGQRLRGKPFLLRLAAFLCLIALFGAILFGTVGPVKLRQAVSGADPAVTGVVTVEQGQLTGLVTGDPRRTKAPETRADFL